jgi:hypothetical protein
MPVSQESEFMEWCVPKSTREKADISGLWDQVQVSYGKLATNTVIEPMHINENGVVLLKKYNYVPIRLFYSER